MMLYNSTAREKYDTEFKEIHTKALAIKNGLSEERRYIYCK